MTFFNRQPKGIPVGGQFAATNHAEPTLTLSAGTPELGTRDTGDMFGAAKDMLRSAMQSHRDRVEARRADRTPRTRPNPLKRRLAVAALVLAAATSMTGCSGQGEECPKADFPTSSSSIAADATITPASFPMRGGHGGGHGSGHVSEHGSTSGSGGFHFWPWSTGSHGSQCEAHPAPTQSS